MKSNYKYLVATLCSTYNHVSYIEETLCGFSIQETTEPIVYIIIDDASTDGEQDLLFDWANKNMIASRDSGLWFEKPYGRMAEGVLKDKPNMTFAILLLNENHYQTGKKNKKFEYAEEWLSNSKYRANCEGDDYWLANNKLQEQIKILENNPNCSMVCTRTRQFSQKKGIFLEDNACHSYSCYLNPNDIILKGGLYISTCSMMYWGGIKANMPSYCVNCHVGDYPLQIMAAMKGSVYYLDEPMAVYRVENSHSWVGQQKKILLTDSRINGLLTEVQMLQGFQQDYPQYAQIFSKRIEMTVIGNMPSRHIDKTGSIRFYSLFKDYIPTFSKKNRLFAKIKSSRLSFILSLYNKFYK